MKVLSLLEPWASLIKQYVRKIEKDNPIEFLCGQYEVGRYS